MNSIKQALDQLSCFDRVVLFFQNATFSTPSPPHIGAATLPLFFFLSGLRNLMNNELKAGMGQGFKAQGSNHPEESGPPKGRQVPVMTVGEIVSRQGLTQPQKWEQGQAPG